MKNEKEYRKELFNAMQDGNTERAKDLKDILQGVAIEPTCYTDLLIAADDGLRIIQTAYTKEFNKNLALLI